jgi:PAS domain S-box-containing protein
MESFAESARAFGPQVGLVRFDAGGHFLGVNRVFCASFGYSSTELVGRHHRVLVPASTAASESYAQMWDALSRGESLTGQFERIARDGTRRWFAASDVPSFEGSAVTGALKLALDVTAFVQLRTQHVQNEALLLTMRSVVDVVLNAMNALKYAYDEVAERAGLAAQERVFFDQCFDGLEATVRKMSNLPSFRAGTRSGRAQLDSWTLTRR